MKVNNILIEFNDGKTLMINNCETFYCYPEKGYAEVIKNGYRVFFNFNKIRYIGRSFDIEGEKQ